MIQYIITLVLIIGAVLYIILKLKKTGKDCTESGCAGCSYYTNCSKDIKKSR